MKISKVNHTRSAVGKTDNGSISGMLYKFPGKDAPLKIDKQFEQLNRTAKRLYNVFNPIMEGTKPQPPKNKDEQRQKNYKIKLNNYNTRERYAGLVSKINKELNSILFYVDKTKNRPEREIREKDFVLNALTKSKFKCKPEEIDGLIALALRKSLEPYSEGVRALLSNLGSEEIRKADADLINILIEGIKEDFNKDADKISIIQSIVNQNMLIQPAEEEGLDGLSLSFAANKREKSRKAREKSGLEAFLSGYADLHEDVREDYLRRLRRLIDLYFWYSPEENGTSLPPQVDESSDYNVWKKHEEGKKQAGEYVRIPDVLANEASGLKQDIIERKATEQELRNQIRSRNIQSYRNAERMVSQHRELFFEKDD